MAVNKAVITGTLFERSILKLLLLLVKDALVFQQLGILVYPAIQRHAHLPWPREDLGIFNRSLVRNVIRVRERITFDHVQSVAVEVTGMIEPGLIVEAVYVHHQRVAIPASP